MKKALFVGLFVAAFSMIAAGQTQPTEKKVQKPVTTEKKVTTVTTKKEVTPVTTKTKVTPATTKKAATTVTTTKTEKKVTTTKKVTTVKKTASAVYTCPMHPEVAMTKPGKCPKCKMELVKKKATV
jgi:hypothetical protein